MAAPFIHYYWTTCLVSGSISCPWFSLSALCNLYSPVKSTINRILSPHISFFRLLVDDRTVGCRDSKTLTQTGTGRSMYGHVWAERWSNPSTVLAHLYMLEVLHRKRPRLGIQLGWYRGGWSRGHRSTEWRRRSVAVLQRTRSVGHRWPHWAGRKIQLEKMIVTISWKSMNQEYWLFGISFE